MSDQRSAISDQLFDRLDEGGICRGGSGALWAMSARADCRTSIEVANQAGGHGGPRLQYKKEG
ncbi:MAG TPA: hypothetical protein VFL82_00725 [Thermomicrobiales bacterium]|nr:hypothetical protein [Thermomicrobiales bacterium]